MVTGVPRFTPVQLTDQVRQRLVAQAVAAMGSLQPKVLDTLINLMDQAAPSREMQLRRDAWMLYQSSKGKWQDGTVAAWQKALATTPAQKKVSNSLKGLSLELESTEAVENKIASSKLALALMEKAAQEVNDLRKRLKFLNYGKALNEADIVHPEVLMLPLVEQWEASGMARDAWPLVSATVQKHFNEHLQSAYEQCNELLIEQGVIPDIEEANSRPSNFNETDDVVDDEPVAPDMSDAWRNPAQDRRNAAGGAARSQQAGGPAGRNSRAQSILAQVGRLLSGAFLSSPGAARSAARAGGGYAGGAGAGFVGADGVPGAVMPPGGGYGGGAAGMMPEGGFVPASGAMPMPQGGAGYVGGPTYFSPGGAMPSGSGMAGMSGMADAAGAQVSGAPGDAAPVRYAGPSVPLMMALAQQPRLSDVHFVTSQGGSQVVSVGAISQVANELRQQSTDLKGKAETDNEKAIIELVALMFQSILQEDRLPSGVRVWFARLQMPVLRIALADPDFFNKIDHPARKLIDHMGSCVLGFDSSGISAEELETEIKRVVQVVEQYPDTGDRVYKRVYEEFQTFLKTHLAKKPAAQKVLGVAEQLEQKETLAIQYTIELRDQLRDMPVREEIRSFLFKVWAEVLAVSTVRQGKQHEETGQFKKSATELIWAASAKPNRTDRAKVIEHLPVLLQSLRSGMTLLGIVRSAQEAHIKIISDTLADAFMSKTEVVADAQIQAMAKRLAELDDFVDEANAQELPLDSENIEELLGIETTDLDVVNAGGGSASPVMMEWARDITLGSWFTLAYKGTTAQVQFVWRSPLGHLHLFANTLGHSYLFQTARLAAYLQSAELEPQEDESLMTRAARNALGQIQANPDLLLA
ncbi:MAG: DUF1631 domain-containing protein [Rhodoferax sp.]|nr:DUF1631 domain-containing protein [Rhodoferax sp.]OIP22474.1 MAG: hypothetical protein AUK52_06060 [Comamonadaceae bacterium CG2_30_60_41]PIW10615.1 MAG: DUF1631 domain-containing protein [Comamonadaceae bacterium CG17_big_fil_post_rev_8_21_14_2_50_60_13]PIY25990.1 MAG: DUF1631 domain-containing protein [Comamonadaceae bacterium CG_4_10_14_3_um_filter_60_75]PJC11784.1 MAG: DUF1631 domain-containing protein [Comamonadaceae bacterium CG_4_9_14_0_8_um_filter_60_18]